MQEKNYKNELDIFSNNLRKLRIDKNKTQIEISFEMNISRRLYQKIESKNPPDIRYSTLYKILKYYNISLEELIKE